MRNTTFIVMAIAACFCCASRAVAEPVLPEDQLARLREYTRLQNELLELFTTKDFEKAAAACRRQIEIVPDSSEPHYNLACAMARLGHKDSAIGELREAVKLGFTDAAHMREDDDLASLRNTADFADLLKAARQKELDAPHEAGADIAGVKTVEGFPEGGLRYRLRIGLATIPEKPARLIIWLHPSGGSMDSVVETLSPLFARNGYALVVFTQKSYGFWSDQDAQRIGKTLPDLAKTPGLDIKKPILLGFSAGGQLALQLWQRAPEQYGGLVIDAAYPLDMQQYAAGKIAPMDLPKNDGIKTCPIFALVGGNDGGSKLWLSVDKAWRAAGVPLSLKLVPAKGHAWLFNAQEIAALADWLKSVAAGEMPSNVQHRLKAPADSEEKIKV